jgi:flagellar biosynthesis chaperone FliJ
MNYRFAKEKKEIELTIYRLTNECEKYHHSLKELEEEQIRLRKQIVNYSNFSKSIEFFSSLG